MKLLLPLGLALCLAVIFVLSGPRRAPAEDTAATPPPLVSPTPVVPAEARGEILPGNVTLSTGAAAKPAAFPEPARTRVEANGAHFLGSVTCSSSLCHGGGSAERNAYTIWKKSDPHHRAAATLAGTRAARIAQGAALASTGSARCTGCHTPLATVAEARLPEKLDVQAEGVSCESCHGPAQQWIRSHTRRDFTHAQNVQTGVRELRDLYARANACVACHQVIAPDLLTAGHPPLLFEMDAQTVAEPRHWTDPGGYYGLQAWLTGQAVALREMSWTLGESADTVPEAREQWRALLWLLRRTAEARGGGARGLPDLNAVPTADEFTPGNVARARADADDFARAAARLEWTAASARRCLDGLAATGKEFVPVAGGEGELALRSRAQRLALGLSRLLAPLQKQDAARWEPASRELDRVFSVADARAVFDGAAFAERLRRFSDEVSKAEAAKQ